MSRPRNQRARVGASRIFSAVEFLNAIPLGTQPPAGRLPADGTRPVPVAADAVNASRRDGKATAATSTSSRGPGARAGSEPLSGTVGAGGTGGSSGGPGGSSGAGAGAAGGDGVAQLSVPLRGDQFRHITSRGHRSSPLFREALLREGVLDGRLLFSSNKDYPTAIFSMIRYDPSAEAAQLKERQAAASRLLIETAGDEARGGGGGALVRWKGRSYARLLHAEFGPCSDERDEQAAAEEGGGAGGLARWHPEPTPYDPSALDDHDLEADAQAAERQGSREGGYVLSVLTFRTGGGSGASGGLTAEAKQELNAAFAQRHPWLDAWDGQGITLSKLRSLRRAATDAWWEAEMEMSTVALAIVSFERLVFKHLINKSNRKLAMAVCLLLAYKMNEAREGTDRAAAAAAAAAGGGGGGGGGDSSVPAESPSRTREVLALLQSSFGVSRKAMVSAEFPVFAHLSFSLHVPAAYTAPHLERLLNAKGTSTAEYLGAVMDGAHASHAH